MAKKPTQTDDDDDLSENEDAPKGKKDKKSKAKKSKLPIILVAVLVLLLGALGGVFALGLLNPLLGIEEEVSFKDENDGDASLELGIPIYYEMEKFTADLKSGECRAPFLQLAMTLQIDKSHRELLREREPKLIDRIHQHIRGKTRQELVGEAGANRLRADLVLVINQTIKPAKVQNVLFSKFVLQ